MKTSPATLTAAQIHADVLRCCKRELDLLLRPELQTDQAQSAAFLISEMLANLIAAPVAETQVANAGSDSDWRAEHAALLALDAAVAVEINPADPMVALEVPVTVAALQAYFDGAGAAAGLGRIENVAQIAGGYSKDTWRLRTSVGIRGNQRLILRRDLPFGPGENTVTEELELLRALHAAGLPVPEPLWHEREHSPVGKPFLLFPELPGKAVFGDWHADRGEQHAILQQLAQVMAKLHALPVQTLPFLAGAAAAVSPQALVRQYVQSWYDKWRRRRVTPSAIMETAYRWLLDHVPADLAAPSIVHGDISLRNTLIDNGRLVALLDWEFWHLGDPIEDLSYFRLVAEPYIAWDDFMHAYRQAGGVDYDEERAAYYAVWRSVRNATTTTTAWHGFLSGAYPVSKAAYQGISLYRFFLNDIATQLTSRGLR